MKKIVLFALFLLVTLVATGCAAEITSNSAEPVNVVMQKIDHVSTLGVGETNVKFSPLGKDLVVDSVLSYHIQWKDGTYTVSGGDGTPKYVTGKVLQIDWDTGTCYLEWKNEEQLWYGGCVGKKMPSGNPASSNPPATTTPSPVPTSSPVPTATPRPPSAFDLFKKSFQPVATDEPASWQELTTAIQKFDDNWSGSNPDEFTGWVQYTFSGDAMQIVMRCARYALTPCDVSDGNVSLPKFAANTTAKYSYISLDGAKHYIWLRIKSQNFKVTYQFATAAAK